MSDTWKLVGVEQQAYLADAVICIVDGHPKRYLNDLLPWAYQATPALKAVAEDSALMSAVNNVAAHDRPL